MLISVFGNQARLQSFLSFSRLCHTDALIGAGLQEVLRQRHRVPDVRRLRIRPDQPTRRKRTSRQNRLRHRQVSYLGGRPNDVTQFGIIFDPPPTPPIIALFNTVVTKSLTLQYKAMTSFVDDFQCIFNLL